MMSLKEEESISKKIYKYTNLLENCDHAEQYVKYTKIIEELRQKLCVNKSGINCTKKD